MEQYYYGLFRYLRVRLRDQHRVADIVHDAYVRILEVSRRQAIEYPQAYLYRTANNIAIDIHRRNATARLEPLEAADGEAGATHRDPPEVLYRDQRLKLVERALGELSAPCRQAFLLRKLEGLSHQEISEHLGISRDMVEKHIVNAMKHCRIRVREWE